ncbi:glycosyltransferase [Altibacter sp. HG106]|uniref:glycosyltransferase n=1 Tax=Altibacter sp. HG106 TaxID=3023937 RepID=UPI0023501ADD|nr:glycosyltransferase [Altibacter sp. HG106]MDC7995852.1 glycosyltransferase [Altibacter sp. HG106]
MTLVFLLAVLAGSSLLYYLFFSAYSFYASEKPSRFETDLPVSLIVCAKNEVENLRKNIPLWLQQEYSNFELILVNDASRDETLEVMESFAESDRRVKVVNVKNIEAFWANKKYALTLGIKKAIHTRLLFTDADCQPASTQWLRLMTHSFSEEKQLILGYGAYQKKSGILNKLIRYETALTALQYLSYTLRGIPYMGVGRNLAYTSHLFYETKGFMSHVKIPSGDDDLFVNEAATAKNVSICTTPDAFTYSHPKTTWYGWWLQKRRHITTASHYKGKHKVLLGFFFITSLLFWPVAIASLCTALWMWALALISLRIVAQYLVYGKAFQKLKEADLIPWIPFLEIFLVSFQLSIFISNTFSKPPRWK